MNASLALLESYRSIVAKRLHDAFTQLSMVITTDVYVRADRSTEDYSSLLASCEKLTVGVQRLMLDFSRVSDDFDLIEALEQWAAQTQAAVSVTADALSIEWPLDVQIAIFRAIQELAWRPIAKHQSAIAIDVQVALNQGVVALAFDTVEPVSIDLSAARVWATLADSTIEFVDRQGASGAVVRIAWAGQACHVEE